MSQSEANLRQHGGAHYMLKEYQHWDWVCDIDLHYLLACASKYASRWKQKGGLLDLDKAVHYLDKAAERDIALAVEGLDHIVEQTQRYVAQFPEHEAEAIMSMVLGEYSSAKAHIELLIAEEKAKVA